VIANLSHWRRALDEMKKPMLCVLLTHYSSTGLSAVQNELIASLLTRCCYCIVCVGEESEFLHDCIDDGIVVRDVDIGRNRDDCGEMTTWHDDEPLEDSVWFFLNVVGVKDDMDILALLQDGDEEMEELLLTCEFL